MAIAKDLLRGDSVSLGKVARRVGYSSSSTFSVASAASGYFADDLCSPGGTLYRG
jgi:AraC-like DNA-binding protein